MKRPKVFVWMAAVMLLLAGCGNKAATIGIIGGADGPTAIFVSSGTSWMNLWGLAGIVAAIVLIAVFLYGRKK